MKLNVKSAGLENLSTHASRSNLVKILQSSFTFSTQEICDNSVSSEIVLVCIFGGNVNAFCILIDQYYRIQRLIPNLKAPVKLVHMFYL